MNSQSIRSYAHDLCQFRSHCGNRLLLACLLAVIWIGCMANALASGQIVSWGSISNVPPGLVGIKAIAGGLDFSLALRNDGSVIEWNSLGEPSTNLPSGLTNIVAIAARAQRLALQADGTVIAWSQQNLYDAIVPPGLSNVTAVAAGPWQSMALRADGTVTAWGVGDATNVPVDVTNVTAIAAGMYSGFALKHDGSVLGWGCSQPIGGPAGLSNIVAIAASLNYLLALRGDGTVLEWNYFGNSNATIVVTNAVSIAAGDQHALALKADGTMTAWGWGNDISGQTNIPPDLTNVIAIAGGGYHSLALLCCAPPTIVTQPISQNLFSGMDCTLSALATSTEPILYQWRLNGGDISGATNLELFLPALTLANAGVYSLVASNSLGFDISQSATVNVIQSAPLISTPPVSQPVRALGDAVTLRVQADGSRPLFYQWNFNGAPIPGATDAMMTIASARHENLGSYTVTIRNTFGSITSDPVPVFLSLDYAFSSANGPLVWDISGAYAAPLPTNLVQDIGGWLWGTDSATGSVTGDGSSVTVNVSSTRYPNYWVWVDDYTMNYVWLTSSSSTLKLDPVTRTLNGSCTSSATVEQYVYFLFDWVFSKEFTESSTVNVSQPLPVGVDGRWDLNVLPDAGQASVTLSSGKVITFPLAVTNVNVTKSCLSLQAYPNYLNLVTLGPQMTLQSMEGMVAGQVVRYQSPAATEVLSLQVNGNGAVKSLANGQSFVIGRDYTLTAVPQPGNIFSNWMVGESAVSSPTLNFTMCSNLTITANFVTNGFIGAKGVYNGLFYEAAETRLLSSGFFTITLANSGSFSGTLSVDGGTCRISGKFDASSQAHLQVSRRGKTALTLQLQLDLANQQINGTVTDGNWTAELFADHAYAGRNVLNDYVGVHTLIIPACGSATNLPGEGYATIIIDFYGKIHASGKLADGTAFSRSVTISPNGLWPLYVPLYANRGCLLSWITFSNHPSTSMSGDLMWFKPANSSGKYYPAGFTNHTAAIGSRFSAPDWVQMYRDISYTNGIVLMTGGDLPGTNTVDLSVTNSLRMKWNPLTGKVTGSFLHPITGRKTSLEGAILQNQNVARGFFLSTNESGSFLLRQ
jgi:hypothetical protein